jgi:crotonobetainyl-CoA:carnitine CoA-transferase CaiB-like acyl-CoA transferase
MADAISRNALADLWRVLGQDASALERVQLDGVDPVFPSSFHVGAAAQVPLAAAALAASELGVLRGQAPATVAVDMLHAAHECSAWFSLDGKTPEIWDAFSGLYRCRDGWVRLHANFKHHRGVALHVLGLDPASATRADAESALQPWLAQDFEDAVAHAGGVAARFRSLAEWEAHPQGQAVAAQPLMSLHKLDGAAALALPALGADGLPLRGLRVLDLTRILAGPACGRLLARLGAEVMLVNSPHLPNIASIADTSRGKLSCHVDLTTAQGRTTLTQLVQQAHVLVRGYRPGGLDALGFSAQELVRMRPGLVVVSLSAARRGFESLVQTASGFNHAEMVAKGSSKPEALPMQILDFATGHLMACAAVGAVAQQQVQGGSWEVQASLAQTGHWLRSLGRVENGFRVAVPPRDAFVSTWPSGFGVLAGVRSAIRLNGQGEPTLRPAMPPGTHLPRWP